MLGKTVIQRVARPFKNGSTMTQDQSSRWRNSVYFLGSQLLHVNRGEIHGFKMQGLRTQAIAKSGRFGTVLKYMSQMGTTTGTNGFGSGHKQEVIFLLTYDLRFDGLPEAGPPCAGLIFGFG